MNINKLNDITSWDDYDSLLKETYGAKDSTNDDNHSNNDSGDDQTNHHHEQQLSHIIEKIVNESVNSDVHKIQIHKLGKMTKDGRLDGHNPPTALLYEKISILGKHHNNNDQDDDNDDRMVDLQKHQRDIIMNDHHHQHDNDATKEVNFQFQWMKPNPALYFQLGSAIAKRDEELTKNQKDEHKGGSCGEEETNGNDSWHIASKVSKMVNIYNNKNSKKRKSKALTNSTKVSTTTATTQEGLEITPGESSIDDDHDIKEYSSLIQFPPMNVDLTKLLDPPLLSQWVPGACTYNPQEKLITQSPPNTKRKRRLQNNTQSTTKQNNDDNEKRMMILFDRICQYATTFMKNHKSQQEEQQQQRVLKRFLVDIIKSIQLNHDTTIDKMKQYKEEEWMNVLPSNLLFQLMMKHAHHTHQNDVLIVTQTITRTSILLVLLVLTNICHTKDLGCHILQILCPCIFGITGSINGRESDDVGNDNDSSTDAFDDDSLTEIENCLMEYLANSLIQNCLGETVSKPELREIMMNIGDVQTINICAWNRLRRYITVAFYNFHSSNE